MIAMTFRKLLRRFDRRAQPFVLLDHVPVQADAADLVVAARRGGKTRDEKIADARARHGRAFKCAGADQDREVMMEPSTIRVVRAGCAPTGNGFKVADHTNTGVVALDARTRAARR